MTSNPPPHRRKYSSAGRKDKDAAASARIFQAMGWAVFPAAVMGLMVAMASDLGTGMKWAAIIVVVAGGGSLLFSEIMGRTTAQLLHPGATTGRREYSGIAALVAKGRYREAADAYELASTEQADDYIPCLKLARLYSERLGDAGSALKWFREARSRGVHPSEERAVMRQMVEAAERGGNGLAAAPDLARYAEERAGTDEETWARTRLRDLKEDLRRREEERMAGPAEAGSESGYMSDPAFGDDKDEPPVDPGTALGF